MKNVLRWTSGIFKCKFKIFSGHDQVGMLKDSEFSSTSFGEIYDEKYRFKTSGVFSPSTSIIDDEDNSLVARIYYSCWYPKATIDFGDKEVTWKFSNIWETKWKIFNKNGLRLNFSGNSCRGKVEMDNQHNLLALTGLYISNYYWKLLAVYIAIFFALFFPGIIG